MELVPSNNCQQMQAQVAARIKQERIDRLKANEETKRKSNEPQKTNDKSQLLQQLNMDIILGRNKY